MSPTGQECTLYARALLDDDIVPQERIDEHCALANHTLIAGARHTGSGSSEIPELGEGGQGRRWSVTDARTLKGTTLWPGDDELAAPDTPSSSDSDSESDGEDGARGDDEVYVSGRTRFFREVAETVSRAFEAARHDPSGAVNLDSVRLEVGSLKLVYDFSFTETAEAILAGLLALLGEHIGARAKLAAVLKRWVPLFDVYLASPSRPADEVELLYKVHELAAASDPAWRSRTSWPALILALMDAGLVQRAQVRAWASSLSDDEDEEEDARTAAADVLRALDSHTLAASSAQVPQHEGESSEDEADLFDDTTDGWFSADKTVSTAKAWWDEDDGQGEETPAAKEEKSEDDDTETDKGKGKDKDLATSGSFWAADDSFEASDED